MSLFVSPNDTIEIAKISFDVSRVESFVRAMCVALTAIGAQWVIVLVAGDVRPKHLVEKLHRFAVNLLVAAVSIQIAHFADDLSRNLAVEYGWNWMPPPRSQHAQGLFNFTLLISALALVGLVSHSPRNALNSGENSGMVNHDLPALGSQDLPWRYPIVALVSGWGSLVAAVLL